MTEIFQTTSSATMSADKAIRGSESPAEKTAKEFEAVFMTQFVDEMMKTVPATAFGGEKQAEMWRSFMSEAVARSLVEQGGLGLSGNVQKMIEAYTNGATRAGVFVK